ncbi:MAG TPA: T9SS type A sorting domain-containing protein [Chitinophagales bacterium]|nr:T9SS type A sorting domain-containing protein [Chitinophagales bacterium]
MNQFTRKDAILHLASLLTFIANGFAQPGNLDSSFGINGKVTTAVCTNSNASSVALQSDGKIVAAGGSLDCISLIRYNSDGSLDSSFGTNGIVTTPASQTFTSSVVIQPNGKIITSSGNEFGWILIRYEINGKIDSSFGTNGEFILGGATYVTSIALQQDSKIIMAGTYSMGVWPHSYYISLARCDSNGIVDTSFQSGTGTFDGYNAGAFSIALQPDGKIITAGKTDSNMLYTPCFGIARFNNNGTPDNSFGINGHVTTAIGTFAEAFSVAIQPDGKIVAVGPSRDSVLNFTESFTIVRYNSNGSLDNSFNGNGIVITSIGTASDANAVAIQTDGKIVVSGSSSQTIALVRYNSNGSLDNSFGINGIVTNGVSTGRAIEIQPDGKILTGGGSSSGFTLIRYLSGLEVGILNLASNSLPTLTYPNPIQSEAVLQYILNNEECITISLYNVLGSKVQNFITNETRNQGVYKEVLYLDEALPPGYYLLSISNDVHSQSIKIVKQ